MSFSLTELRKIISFCRRNGVLYYKNDGFEFRITKQALRLPKQRSKKVAIPIAGLQDSNLSKLDNMDLLLWSAAGPFTEEQTMNNSA